MTSATVILSPHFDDAALSCWVQVEEPGATVSTVFSKIPDDPTPSRWDRSSGHTNAIEVMEARAQENREVLRRVGAPSVDLGLLDSAYRTTHPSPVEIADRIDDLVDRDRLVVAPAAIGTFGRSHGDHVLVREAAKVLVGRGRDVVFYADIPYILPMLSLRRWPDRLSPERIGRTLGLDVTIEPVELGAQQQERKRRACLSYRTQFRRVNQAAFGALSRRSAYHWEALIRPV